MYTHATVTEPLLSDYFVLRLCEGINSPSEGYLSAWVIMLTAYPVPARDVGICDLPLTWCLATCPFHVTFINIKSLLIRTIAI